MKKHGKTFAPRLPELAREKLKTGGGHKTKKDHNRQRENNALRKLMKDSFFELASLLRDISYLVFCKRELSRCPLQGEKIWKR